MGKKGGERRDSSFHMMLPEGCLAKVLSFTSPRLSVVSSLFKSAADSDIVWRSFFPHDYRSIIFQSNSSLQLASVTSSMNELYLNLCDKPILIENGRKSFSLNKPSGKKCFMPSAKSLEIAWKDFRLCWRWDSDPESRFDDQVAHLLRVPTLTIIGKISARMLSPATWYTAYLVFKFFTVHFGSKQKNGFSLASGFDGLSAKVSVGLVGGKTSSRTVFWDVEGWRLQNRSNKRRCSVSSTATSNIYYPKDRGDGWLEIRLGDFFIMEGEDGDLEMIVDDNIYHVKKGLVIEGIEIKPK